MQNESLALVSSTDSSLASTGTMIPRSTHISTFWTSE